MGELYINSIPPKISKINYPKIQFPQKSKNPVYVVWRFPKLPMEVSGGGKKRVKLWPMRISISMGKPSRSDAGADETMRSEILLMEAILYQLIW